MIDFLNSQLNASKFRVWHELLRLWCTRLIGFRGVSKVCGLLGGKRGFQVLVHGWACRGLAGLILFDLYRQHVPLLPF